MLSTRLISVFLLVLSLKQISSCEISVDISTAVQHNETYTIFDGIYFHKNHTFRGANNELRGCICEYKTCIRKCCPENQYFHNDTAKCLEGHRPVKPNIHDGEIIIDRTHHFIIDPIPFGWCNGSKIVLKPRLNEYDVFQLQKEGHLILTSDGITVEALKFCADYIGENKEFGVIDCLPYTEEASKIPDHLYYTGMIISLPFLLVTFLVYAITPELRNLHGKCLMCYVMSLFVAYIFLVTLQIGSQNHSAGYCKTAPFIVYFAFMVSFLWLNVMCIDIWWTFSGRRGFVGSIKKSENKRFLVYSAYAWGVALIFVIVTLIMQYGNVPDGYIKPNFGEGRCWFSDEKPVFAYFYGPIMTLLLINIVLFSWTTYKIYAVKKETAKSMRNDSQRHGADGGSDKQRFKLYLKLFIVFGVNWSMEIISWYVDSQTNSSHTWIWYITDMCNAMYGVLIFIIFVCKQNVWRLAKKRFGIDDCNIFKKTKETQENVTTMTLTENI